MMGDLKHLRDITMFYDRLHPELHSRTDPGQHERDSTERQPADTVVTDNMKNN